MKEYFERLKKAIDKHDRIILMTHAVPDLDGLGSAIVFSEIMKKMGKECYIVAPKNLINKSLNKTIKYLNDKEIVIPFKYEKNIDLDGMLVIFDTCENKLVECRDLFKIRDKFIIDHHSKCDDLISGDMFLDDSKSSTIEIISEFIKYLDIKLDDIYYTILYAGLYQDTNGFILKTLPRTFEIAAFLLESGANIKVSYGFLKEKMDSVVGRYDYIKNCMEIKGGIYLCVVDGPCSSITVAKIADEMLKFEEVDAAIAVGGDDIIFVSARSFDNIDVCSWMVKLGGGGHFGAAAAKINMSLEEAILEIKNIVKGE